ncbi:MFS transporter [Nocardia concava]|uniref:MFS transporter n=1 Tax=Nocardia concava TaxID=257281 RepID=UPI0003184A50|nr:MFS transporter [Nocardia concava]
MGIDVTTGMADTSTGRGARHERPAGSAEARRHKLALLVICLAELIVMLDTTIVNVALPSIGLDLRAATSGLQWVVDAYTLVFAGLLLAFGNIGDRYGRRRVMSVGLFGIAAVSGVAVFADSLGAIVGVRAFMGVMAAAVFPATLALIVNIFREPKERAAAVGAWAAMAGAAVVFGPLAGGLLLEHFSWHSVFWVNIPAAGLVGLLTLAFVPESKATAPGPLDVPGLVLSIASISLLVWALIEAPHNGWLSGMNLAAYLGAAILLVAFVFRELHAPAPVLDVTLFRMPFFAWPALAIAAAYFTMFGFLFMFTQYFQAVRGMTPLEFGVHSLPFAAAVLVGAPLSTVLAQRIGTTPVVVTGLLILSSGIYVAGQVQVESDYVGPVLASMVLMGFGLAVVQGPATETIMASVSEESAGSGSAVNDTTREVGGTLGVAVMGSIVASIYRNNVQGAIAAVPDAVMSPQEKEFALGSPLSIIQITDHPTPPTLDGSKFQLIYTLKWAALDGFHLAADIGLVIVLAAALIVAVSLPWRRSTDVVEPPARQAD